MTFQPRSQYELGDPVAAVIAREEQAVHHRARARGQRLLLLADALVDELQAHAMLRAADGVIERRLVFHILATALYGNAALTVPDFTDPRSLDALRRA